MNRTSAFRSALTLSLLAAFPLANCQCEGDLEELPTPEIEILDEDGNSQRDADPWLTVSFGDVDNGQSATQTLTVRNRRTGVLRFTSICLVAAASLDDAIAEAAPCVQASTAPFSMPNILTEELGPEEEVELPVTFRPGEGGPAQYFLRVVSNDEELPITAVELTGRGTAGRLCADETILDFGAVFIGETKTLSLTLTNCGVRPVQLDTFEMLQNPDEVFSVSIDGAAPDAALGELPQDASITLDVTFAPAQLRVYRDSLAGIAQITTAAPFAGEYQLLFVGDARTPPVCRINVVPQTVNFGAVAAGNSDTRDMIIQSIGECACEVTAIGQPDPASAGFTIDDMPALPFVLSGTGACDGDPSGADGAPSTLTVPVTYAVPPDRDTPTTDNATVTVTTTDPDTPTQTVDLEANGGGTPFCQFEVTPQGGGLLGQGAAGRDGVAEFGRVTIYGEKQIPIELKNVGNDLCQITGVDWDVAPNTTLNEFGLRNADGTDVAVGAFPTMTIQPGDSALFYAVFAPTRTIEGDGIFDVFNFGSYSANNDFCESFIGNNPNERCNGVRFTTTDDTSTPENGPGIFSIGFSATPVEPAIDVIPGSLDFGLVTLGCGSPEQCITVYNTGNGDLVIDEPYISPDNTPPDFVITAVENPTGTYPYTIPPGDSMGICVRYYAQDEAVTTGDLVIPTVENGQTTPPVTVPLSGEGTIETGQTDIFEQFDEPKVDVLWVVDDSGSMGPFQDLMASNFGSFFTVSNVAAANYHIAVTTTLTTDGNCIDPFGVQTCETDPMSGYYAACPNNDRFLDPSSSSPASQFQCNVKVSNYPNSCGLTEIANPCRPSSDNAEGALQAAREFLQPPKIDDPAINGGFLRDDAKLHIIMVSDEPDQSTGPVDLYIDFFKNIKGWRNEGLTAVSAIAVPESGCTMSDGTQLAGDPRYETVVTEMNGRFQPICDTDWTTMMANLGLDSLGLQIEFFLTRAADPNLLSVCVRAGGPGDTCTPVAQTDDTSMSGYFYDSASNSIVFNPNDVPPQGAIIEATYETICYP